MTEQEQQVPSNFKPDDHEIPEIPEVPVYVAPQPRRLTRKDALALLVGVPWGGTMVLSYLLGRLNATPPPTPTPSPPTVTSLFKRLEPESVAGNGEGLTGVVIALNSAIGKVRRMTDGGFVDEPLCVTTGGLEIFAQGLEINLISFSAFAGSAATANPVTVSLPIVDTVTLPSQRANALICELSVFSLDGLPTSKPYAVSYEAVYSLGSGTALAEQFTARFSGPNVTRVNQDLYGMEWSAQSGTQWVFTGPAGNVPSFATPVASTLSHEVG